MKDYFLEQQFYIDDITRALPEMDKRLVSAIDTKSKLKKRFYLFNVLTILLSVALSAYVFLATESSKYLMLLHLILLLFVVYSNYKVLIEIFTLRERVTNCLRVTMRAMQITSTANTCNTSYSLDELKTIHNHLISDGLALPDIRKNSFLVGISVIEI